MYGVWMSNRRRRGRSTPRIPRTPRQAVLPSPEPPAVIRRASQVERLAYTRSQAAEALGVSRSTFVRRVLPYVETIEMPWGALLIPVDELDRLLTERRQSAKPRPAPPSRGRPQRLSELVVERIQAAHTAGESLGEIARNLTADGIPTAQGGRQWWPSTIRAVLTRSGDARSRD
jgi:recombinase